MYQNPFIYLPTIQNFNPNKGKHSSVYMRTLTPTFVWSETDHQSKD